MGKEKYNLDGILPRRDSFPLFLKKCTGRTHPLQFQAWSPVHTPSTPPKANQAFASGTPGSRLE